VLCMLVVDKVIVVRQGALLMPPCTVLVLPMYARLDNDVGTGVHLTPTGIEFDERRLTLGNSTEVGGSHVCFALVGALHICLLATGHHWVLETESSSVFVAWFGMLTPSLALGACALFLRPRWGQWRCALVRHPCRTRTEGCIHSRLK
jgi:hypothetical protein